MSCTILDRLEANLVEDGRKSRERGDGWSGEELASLAAVKDHLREGHGGKPCPDPENPIKN